jgi:LysR family transcriptional regulator, glycine cleavage system transcriptional activator
MSRDLPPLNALKAFEASARRGSFTAAADELNVTQGAISRHVKNLEERLGVSLFERLPTGLALTETGQRYLPAVRDSFDRLASATAEIKRPQMSHVLTVSASPNFSSKWLVHRLGDFSKAHPDISLRVAAQSEHIDLSVSDVDVAIRHGEGDWPDVHVTKLVSELVYPVVSPVLLEGGAPLKTPDDLRHYTLLRDLSSNDWRSGWRRPAP